MTVGLAEPHPEHFHTGPGGLPGNDDAGSMSAWYVWSALGLYPLSPGEARYVLGSPLFERATIRLNADGSRRFVIEAPGNAPDTPYVRAMTLNGEPFEGPWITHEQIMAGGTLVMEMSATP
jgi:putative alpha-1,2-mannosidase